MAAAALAAGGHGLLAGLLELGGQVVAGAASRFQMPVKSVGQAGLAVTGSGIGIGHGVAVAKSGSVSRVTRMRPG